MTLRHAALAAAISALFAASGAQATNGYFSHGYGTKSKGLAGAGVALSQDALAAATNPAGMAFVGHRMDIGAAAFSPQREYTSGTPVFVGPATGPFVDAQTIESDNEFFIIPHFGFNMPLGDFAVGLSVYGNGGMNTSYKGGTAFGGAPGTFGDGTAGVDLVQLFIAATYASKFSENAAWGITPILAAQRFRAKGVSTFGIISNDPGNLSRNEHEWSYGGGIKLGVQGEVSPGLRVGASVQSKIYMTEFDKYAGLFAEQGDFDIPATATIGLAWQATPSTTVVFDIQQIWYSDVNAISNPLRGPFGRCTGADLAGPPDASYCLGGDNGIGFGWDDMTVFKLGVQWKSSPDWTWRVGYSYGEQPIPKSEPYFNILAPAVIEQHITFGFTKALGQDNELNFAALWAPSHTLHGRNSVNDLSPANNGQTIDLKMRQYELELSYAWKF